MFKPTSILFIQKTNLKSSTINIDTNNTLNTSTKLNNFFISDHMRNRVKFTYVKLMLYWDYNYYKIPNRIIIMVIISFCLSLLIFKTLDTHCMQMGMAGMPGPGGQGDEPNDGFNFPENGNNHQSYHYKPRVPGTRKGEEINLQPILDRISRGDVTTSQRYRIQYLTQYVLNHNGDLPPQVGVVPSNIDREHGEQPSGTRGLIVLVGVVIMGIVLYYNADHVRQFIWQALPSIMQPPLTQGVTEVAQQFPERLPDFAAAIWEVMREQDPSL